MKGRFCCFVVVVLQIVSWVCVTSRPMAPNDDDGVHQPGTAQSPESLQVILSSKKGYKGMSGMGETNGEASNKGAVNKIGSSPPSCEHKCFECIPCQAIQVPTTTSHVGVQYANYEPEGWKCKCGLSFYTP
ncbi:hypothetical protein F0562_024162 [Nyssa sinensis]|uniref:Epidermal patterning factor-like protein n=1 Tax=Nyssa sinensis TaxID=561372 RepID=A0A5J5BAQ9_9ASTE|nr:hypothetical protein F0562_024162 [Nyssa sinensis]